MSPHVGTYPIGNWLPKCFMFHLRVFVYLLGRQLTDGLCFGGASLHPAYLMAWGIPMAPKPSKAIILWCNHSHLEMHIFATMVWRVMVMAWGGWNMVKLKTQQTRHVATRRRVWCHHLPGWSTCRPRCPHAPGHGEIAAGTNGKCQRQPPLFGGGSKMGYPGADGTTTYK